MLQAKEDETSIVYEGIYHENVVIDKPLVLREHKINSLPARADFLSYRMLIA